MGLVCLFGMMLGAGIRGVHFSVRDRTGPRTGSDRIGPVLFCPVLGSENWEIRASVRWTGPMDRN